MRKPENHGPARIEQLRVQNYRALRDIEFKGLTPSPFCWARTVAVSRPDAASTIAILVITLH